MVLRLVIPKDEHKEGNPQEDTGVLSCPGPWYCWETAPDEIVYELMSFLDEHAEEYSAYTKGFLMGGQYMGNLPTVTKDDLHPAALKYFEDHDIELKLRA